jgi:hypothetical protein
MITTIYLQNLVYCLYFLKDIWWSFDAFSELSDLDLSDSTPCVSRLDSNCIIYRQVSDPESPQYGQYLSIQDLTNLLAPAEEDIAAVVSWLESHDISDYVLNTNKVNTLPIDTRVAHQLSEKS